MMSSIKALNKGMDRLSEPAKEIDSLRDATVATVNPINNKPVNGAISFPCKFRSTGRTTIVMRKALMNIDSEPRIDFESFHNVNKRGCFCCAPIIEASGSESVMINMPIINTAGSEVQ